MKTIKELACEMVGDGKKPNKFFAFCSSHFLVEQDWPEEEGHHFDGVSEVLPSVDVGNCEDEGKMFDNIEDAVEYAESFQYEMEEQGRPEKNKVNSVRIEDRLCGVVWEASFHARLTKSILGNGYYFTVDVIDDRPILEKLSA